MKSKTNYRIVAPIVVGVIFGFGCCIHSIEYNGSITAYYALTVLVSGFGFAFGKIHKKT